MEMFSDDVSDFFIRKLFAKSTYFQCRNDEISDGNAYREGYERKEQNSTDNGVRIGEVLEQGENDECGQKDNDKENNPFVKLVQVILFKELPDLIIQNLDL